MALARTARSFTDKWDWQDSHDTWQRDIRADWPAVHAVVEAAKLAQGMDTAAYLCWLGARVIEMHRVLKGMGSLYLHY